jgi:uncharacterized protein (TIGR02646 family)
MIRVKKPSIGEVNWKELIANAKQLVADPSAMSADDWERLLKEWKTVFELAAEKYGREARPLAAATWEKMLIDWMDILESAVKGRASLISAFDSKGDAEVDDRVYKKYMRFLLTLFNGKCAYCESDIESTQPGDVEHFRPKGRVVDDAFKPIRVCHPKWGDIDHPGYFWLAYEWKNLFPSCIDCNRYRKHGNDPNSGAGKADRFPVENFRATLPDEEHKERALLIDPSALDPNDHLEFLESGIIKPKTDVGEATLKYLGLNRRETLVKARKLAFSDAKKLFEGYTNALFTGNVGELAEPHHRINDMWLGREPYTAMQRLGIETVRKRGERAGFTVPLPLP